MRREVIGPATLYLGDCLEVMPGLEGVDHVITDPPYAETTHSKARTNHNPDGKVKDVKGGAAFVDFDRFTQAAFRELCGACVRVASRWVVMTCDHRHAPIVFDWPEFIRLGAWVKVGPMPQITGDRPGQAHEAVICLHREGAKRWNRGGGPALWTFPPVKHGARFPTQKPEALIRAFVSDFTDPGETILDPCMGSGTTGVAALSMGRRFIGIEKRPDAFDIACERIARAEAQEDLFVQRPTQAGLEL